MSKIAKAKENLTFVTNTLKIFVSKRGIKIFTAGSKFFKIIKRQTME